MRQSMATLTVMLLLAAHAGATAAQPGEQPDLSPPRLKAVRWQYLEKRFQDVYVDGSGRAWFVIRTFNADQSLGQQTHMVCTEAAQSVIEVPASSYPLGESIRLYDQAASLPAAGLAGEAFARANEIVLLHKAGRWREMLDLAKQVQAKFPQMKATNDDVGMGWYVADARKKLSAKPQPATRPARPASPATKAAVPARQVTEETK